jgi:hypothetical protein
LSSTNFLNCQEWKVNKIITMKCWSLWKHIQWFDIHNNTFISSLT